MKKQRWLNTKIICKKHKLQFYPGGKCPQCERSSIREKPKSYYDMMRNLIDKEQVKFIARLYKSNTLYYEKI